MTTGDDVSPAVRIRSSTNYRRPGEGEATSPFARSAIADGERPDWLWETVQVSADYAVADRLGIAVGDPVNRTIYRYQADGRSVQLATSWEPLAVVAGTPVEEPEGEDRTTGVVARMDSIGVRIERAVEVVEARTATASERAALELAEGALVFEIGRTYYSLDRAVETADIVIPAGQCRLEYVIPIE